MEHSPTHPSETTGGEKKGDNPIQVWVERHRWWKQAEVGEGQGPQEWAFDRADTMGHKVCIVLQRSSHRLYTSFPDTMTFWIYYSTFQGPRSFYWINRSFWKKDEVSLLYFDIEWFSESEDPTAGERLAIIKQAVTSSLPQKCRFIIDPLSRPDKKWGWKNSWHIYTDVTLEHNAEGCMKTLVVNPNMAPD